MIICGTSSLALQKMYWPRVMGGNASGHVAENRFCECRYEAYL